MLALTLKPLQAPLPPGGTALWGPLPPRAFLPSGQRGRPALPSGHLELREGRSRRELVSALPTWAFLRRRPGCAQGSVRAR